MYILFAKKKHRNGNVFEILITKYYTVFSETFLTFNKGLPYSVNKLMKGNKVSWT